MKRNTKKGPILPKVLSDRGIHLEKAHRASEKSNIHDGETSFVLESGGNEFSVKVGTRCPQCKMRVRGLNHENGDHHLGIVTKCRKRS